jgi:glycosyltransferase involved in cell wall biosynthesis
VLGRVEQRKNSRRVLEAYQAFREQSQSTTKLVFVGRPGFGWSEIDKTCQALPADIKKDVLMLGYQDNQITLEWLKTAQALVYPSLYEGFGIPVLEAQAAGVPVITSNISSMPEVGGEAALYVNPLNTQEITNAFSRLTNDQKKVNDLIESGRKNAKSFTWEIAAQQTLAALTTVRRGE